MDVWKEILEFIQQAEEPCFLLGEVSGKIPKGHHFSDFEFWLNHFSGLNDEENFRVRAKIVGKWIPRREYQAFFPIGMGKQFPGSHLVAAHLSPDLDTTVASFFGWLDAFSARVAKKQHYWALAGGPPAGPHLQLFDEIFHERFFNVIPRTNSSLTLSAQDLLNREAMCLTPGETPVSTLDHRGDTLAMILVDKEGCFIGDWQSRDVEPVRQVTILFKSCLHWLSHHIHMELTTFLSQENIQDKDRELFLKRIFASPLKPITEFDEEQKEKFLLFLTDVLNFTHTLTLQAFMEAIEAAIPNTFQPLFERLQKWPLIELINDRPRLFQWVQQTFHLLDRACQEARDWAERLSVAIAIKKDVLQISQETLFLHTEVSTMQRKIGNKPFLTVLSNDIPVGVVFSKDVHALPLGTVSIRDFCNEEEMNLASYLNVISIIDHHKSNLMTKHPPLALIGDTQSTNVLIAETTFTLNDRYKRHPTYWISPEREHAENLLFLHAILDDTDLMTKVCERDITCIADLLTRLSGESILLPDEPDYARKGAETLLQTPTMQTLYTKIQSAREHEVEKLLANDTEALFSDTKILNNCCRIGQTKIFPENLPSLQKKLPNLRESWATKAKSISQNQPHLDLHLHMISTIPPAKKTDLPANHLDEIWFYIPPTTQAKDHLISFLSAFQSSPQIAHHEMNLCLIGPTPHPLEEIFTRYFIPLPIENIPGPQSFAYLRIPPSSLNSRKSMISPYLPKIA